jgi:hypothetical protein
MDRMADLGMKLHRKPLALPVFKGNARAIEGTGNCLRSRGHGHHLISVAHPDELVVWETGKK